MGEQAVKQRTMQAYVQSEYGTPEVATLVERPVPTPEPDQIVIRVHASSVNPYDWHMMTGTPRVARLAAGLFRPKEERMGRDVSGVVAAEESAKIACSFGYTAFARHFNRVELTGKRGSGAVDVNVRQRNNNLLRLRRVGRGSSAFDHLVDAKGGDQPAHQGDGDQYHRFRAHQLDLCVAAF